MRTWIIVVIAAAALSLLPGFAAAHGGSEVAVTGHPHPDGPIDIEGKDFEANEIVKLELRKQGEPPLQLGSVPVGADGTFAVTRHVADTVRPGLYQLVATTAGEETTSAEATILGRPGERSGTVDGAGTKDISNDRPTDETVGLAIVTAVLAVAGVAVILLGRHRAARPLAES